MIDKQTIPKAYNRMTEYNKEFKSTTQKSVGSTTNDSMVLIERISHSINKDCTIIIIIYLPIALNQMESC